MGGKRGRPRKESSALQDNSNDNERRASKRAKPTPCRVQIISSGIEHVLSDIDAHVPRGMQEENKRFFYNHCGTSVECIILEIGDTKQGAINIFKKLQEDNPEWESFDKDTTDIIPSRSHALVPDFDDPYDTQVCYITDRLKQKEWLIQRPESSEQVEAAGEVQEMVTSGVVTDSESSTMEWNIGDNPEKELLDISYHHKSPCMCEVGDSQYDCGEVTVQPSVFSISDIPSTQDIIAEFDTNQQIKQFGFALRKKRREDLE